MRVPLDFVAMLDNVWRTQSGTEFLLFLFVNSIEVERDR